MVKDRDKPDEWAQAREAARSEVAAVLAPRERRCPSCGQQQRVSSRVCTNCGAELSMRSPRRKPSRRTLIAVGLALVAVLAVVIPIVSSLRDNASEERAAAAKRQAALEAAERVRLRRDAQPRRGQGPKLRAGADPIAQRAALVSLGERLMTQDARGRIKTGSIDGPIAGVECTPFPHTAERNAAEADPKSTAGRYDCVAYKTRFAAPDQNGQQRTGLFGYPYWLVVDYPTGRLTWCKVTPKAGEGGRSLAFVPVPEPCLDPNRNKATS